MIAPVVGGVIGVGVFAFMLYTGRERTVTRWRDTPDPMQRAAQMVVALISNAGLLVFIAAAAVGNFVATRQDHRFFIN